MKGVWSPYSEIDSDINPVCNVDCTHVLYPVEGWSMQRMMENSFVIVCVWKVEMVKVEKAE